MVHWILCTRCIAQIRFVDRWCRYIMLRWSSRLYISMHLPFWAYAQVFWVIKAILASWLALCQCLSRFSLCQVPMLVVLRCHWLLRCCACSSQTGSWQHWSRLPWHCANWMHTRSCAHCAHSSGNLLDFHVLRVVPQVHPARVPSIVHVCAILLPLMLMQGCLIGSHVPHRMNTSLGGRAN